MRSPEPSAAPAVAYPMQTPPTSSRSRVPRAFARGLAVALLLASGVALATPDEAAQREIDHLLEFVAASNCTFVRSGERFSSQAARDHLTMKYNFVKFRLSTADEFVKYLATESSTTGEPYMVICDKQERPAGVWLTTELKRFRGLAQTAPR